MTDAMVLYIVIPCYNEGEVLYDTIKSMRQKLKDLINSRRISDRSKIVFVNDGSSDTTWSIIQCACISEPNLFSGIDLAHNVGHQNAVYAGLITIMNDCDAAITIDADLQDDIDAIDEMVSAYYTGNDVVYGVRSIRSTDHFLKRFTAEHFYKFMKHMGADIVYNHADFRLMSRRVLQALSEYHEINLFLRGIIPSIGYHSTSVYYTRRERMAGESKYSVRKMFDLAINGITSFSVKPIRMIFAIGIFLCAVSFILFILLCCRVICNPLLPCLFLIGGLHLTALGVIGEYIGKIYSEVKHRPRYIISEYLHDSSGE